MTKKQALKEELRKKSLAGMAKHAEQKKDDDDDDDRDQTGSRFNLGYKEIYIAVLAMSCQPWCV